MKFVAFAAAALCVASPVFATPQQRARPGGDPDLDLSLRPRADARIIEADRDDDVYLPGLTEPAGADSAADMSRFKGEGGPLDETRYPLCSARITDRCIQAGNPAG